jgi:uncharacterized DUF497 family protein
MAPKRHHFNVVLDATEQLCYIACVKTLKEMQFQWDLWNIQKNELKHGVSAIEAESAFYDQNYKLFHDRRHSRSEHRFILLGKSLENRILMIGFTLRIKTVRIITARSASKSERLIYEKK